MYIYIEREREIHACMCVCVHRANAPDTIKTHPVCCTQIGTRRDEDSQLFEHALLSRIKQRMLAAVLAQSCLHFLVAGAVQRCIAVLHHTHTHTHTHTNANTHTRIHKRKRKRASVRARTQTRLRLEHTSSDDKC